MKKCLCIFLSIIFVAPSPAATSRGRANYNVVQNPRATATNIQSAPVSQAPESETIEPQKTIADIEDAAVSAASEDNSSQILELNAAIRELEDEMFKMDSELRRCDRMRRDWRTATIIGGIGVVGTATGAIIQAAQISKQKKENTKTDAPQE
ncbi:MAG: hypothetical protein LBJ73_01070 [Rickettsiales bacterium]|jgi:hypothetical protein|nr:hypothetical protein [Rickettsiales bacterium]